MELGSVCRQCGFPRAPLPGAQGQGPRSACRAGPSLVLHGKNHSEAVRSALPGPGIAEFKQRKAFELMLEAVEMPEVTTACYEEMVRIGQP